MRLRRVDGAAGGGCLAGPVAQHVQPQHRHPVLKIDQVLTPGRDGGAGMFDKAQFGGRVIGQDQAVRSDLDLAIGDLQRTPEQHRHPCHMKNMPLVTCRLPMRKVEPRQIDQRRTSPHEPCWRGIQRDKRHLAEIMLALFGDMPSAPSGMP